jgi:hypothetical protein
MTTAAEKPGCLRRDRRANLKFWRIDSSVRDGFTTPPFPWGNSKWNAADPNVGLLQLLTQGITIKRLPNGERAKRFLDPVKKVWTTDYE